MNLLQYGGHHGEKLGNAAALAVQAVKEVNFLNAVKVKTSLFPYYKQLYTDIGLYEQFKPQIYRYLVSTAEHS